MTATQAHPFGEPIAYHDYYRARHAYEDQGEVWPFALNIGLLRAVLTRISADPAHWDQSMWSVMLPPIVTAEGIKSCGTTYCVAGWTTHLAGAIDERDQTGALTGLVSLGEDVTDIANLAERLLGISPAWADRLFNGHNSAIDVWRIAGEIAKLADLELGVPLPAWATS